MRVLVIDNYAESDLGLVGEVLAAAGVDLDRRHAWRGDPLPADARDHDALVIMGGPQDALDDAAHPYLPRAAALARACTVAGKAVLGICLGAQLVARGHGGRNVLGRPIEFGWHPVMPTAAGRADPLLACLGEAAPVFHWHYDTFELPPGAAHLATSARTPHQAIRLGARTYAIQFHFEAGTDVVAGWTRQHLDWITPHTPDWPARHAGELARHGAAADAVGRDLARTWLAIAAGA